jgi:hypothetical protein
VIQVSESWVLKKKKTENDKLFMNWNVPIRKLRIELTEKFGRIPNVNNIRTFETQKNTTQRQ